MIFVTSVDTIRIPVVDVISQLIRDVIGRLSVEPRCNWLGRLTVIGAFRSVCRSKGWSKVCTCIVEYVGQYCESKSVCCLSVDVVDVMSRLIGQTYVSYLHSFFLQWARTSAY